MARGSIVLLLGLVLAISSAALACSDDKDSEPSGDPLDAYFADLGDIGNDFLDSIVLEPQGLDTSAPIAEQVDVYQTYLEGASRDIERAKNDLDDLDAPPDVASAHADLLAAVENALTTAEGVESQIGEINSSEDMQALAGNQDILTALAQFHTACLALKDIATENDIQREVRCE